MQKSDIDFPQIDALLSRLQTAVEAKGHNRREGKDGKAKEDVVVIADDQQMRCVPAVPAASTTVGEQRRGDLATQHVRSHVCLTDIVPACGGRVAFRKDHVDDDAAKSELVRQMNCRCTRVRVEDLRS